MLDQKAFIAAVGRQSDGKQLIILASDPGDLQRENSAECAGLF